MAGRFARIPPEIAADDRLSGRALRVLIALCSFVNSNGECWPSLATLSRQAAIDRRKISELLRELETCGWITRERRQGLSGGDTSTRYTVTYPKEVSDETGSDARPQEPAAVPADGAPPVPPEGAPPVAVYGAPLSPPAGLHRGPVGGALTEELFNRPTEQKKRNRESDGRKKRRLRLRLPHDTALTDDWREIIAERRPDLDAGRVFDSFKRYWTDPDITERPNAAKSAEGWQRAWINWIERERHGSGHHDQRHRPTEGSPGGRAASIFAAGAWALDQADTGENH